VDLKLGQIRVNRSKSKAGERLVPMTDRVKKLLYVQIGKRTGGWLFPSPRYRGQPIKRNALTAAWRKKAAQAGVSPDVDLYCARHTYGTDIMQATKDPFLTMQLMGHTELSTTERYQHPNMAHIGELMNARNDLRHSSCHSDHLVQ
jgi:integrase/recombinase XerD